jgi:hypothetical protein
VQRCDTAAGRAEVRVPRPYAGWLQASQALLSWCLESPYWDRRLMLTSEEGENSSHYSIQILIYHKVAKLSSQCGEVFSAHLIHV